ncbi:hypothetical protein AAFF_G00220930 [Aldrovandia affinis]|uniref:Uncharacterized protein n=1 Tax=Aldrovandia affinis TaxID=143900 RepID=A0AAD7RFK7_9TELE|nr:hypothetical protein AAFF_G00220930 [Aldrovandia affinis]
MSSKRDRSGGKESPRRLSNRKFHLDLSEAGTLERSRGNLSIERVRGGQGLQGGEREPGGEPQDAGDERVLAQDRLLRGGQTAAEEEEEEEDRPQHDRGAHELHAPDAHRLRGDGRGPAAVRVGPGTDEVKRTQRQRPQQPLVAGSRTNPGSLSSLPVHTLTQPSPTRPDLNAE